MLLHYFTDKEELMTASLTIIVERLVIILEESKTEKMPFQTLIPHLARMSKNPQMRQFMRIGLELASESIDGEEYYRQIAKQILDRMFDWVSSALKVEREDERRPMASMVVAIIEGFVFLDAVDSDWIITSSLEGISRLYK